jgi:hypothetical protein
MGLNEAAGYLAVAATALATGYLTARYGLSRDNCLRWLSTAVVGVSSRATTTAAVRGFPAVMADRPCTKDAQRAVVEPCHRYRSANAAALSCGHG